MPATHILINPWYVGNSVFPYRRFAGARGGKDNFYVEGATQTWKGGDLLFVDGTSDVKICADNGTILTGLIAGQAQGNASGVTANPVHMAIIRPTDRFIMNVFHGTPASAVTVETQLGSVFPLRHASSRWMVDIETAGEGAAAADAVVKVVGFPKRHPLLNIDVAIGDIYGLVEVEFLEFSAATDFAPFIRRLQLA